MMLSPKISQEIIDFLLANAYSKRFVMQCVKQEITANEKQNHYEGNEVIMTGND